MDKKVYIRWFQSIRSTETKFSWIFCESYEDNRDAFNDIFSKYLRKTNQDLSERNNYMMNGSSFSSLESAIGRADTTEWLKTNKAIFIRADDLLDKISCAGCARQLKKIKSKYR